VSAFTFLLFQFFRLRVNPLQDAGLFAFKLLVLLKVAFFELDGKL
jgi:hypothetical protein